MRIKKQRVAVQCICCRSNDLNSSMAVLMPFVADRIFGWKPVTINESWGLATISLGNAYALCKSLQCISCGHLFLDIRFSEDELVRLYKDYRGEQYNALREHYEPGYTQRNAMLNAGIGYIPDIEDFLKPHLDFPVSILDWGGDTGKNTPFQTQCSKFHIYDISNKELISGARIVSKEEAKLNKYQLIVCSNVLEHLPYPSDALEEIAQIMQPDSILYIEVPFEDIMKNDAADSYLRKKHWHEHINFFSEKSLRSLVDFTGLQVLDLKILSATAGGKAVNLFQVACSLKSI